MSESKHPGRVPHRVRQGRRPPHPPRRQGARRPLRPRHRPGPHHPARATTRCWRSSTAAPTPCSTIDLDGNDAAGAAQAGPARPDQGLPRARRPDHRAARARRSPSTIPVHVVGEAAPRRPGRRPSTRRSRVEAEATHIPEYVEVSIEGAEVGTQILAKDLDAARGLDRCSLDDERADRQRHARADRRGGRGRARRGRGRGRHRARRVRRGDRRGCRGRRGRGRRGRGRRGRARPSAATLDDASESRRRAGDPVSRRRPAVWLVVGLGQPRPVVRREPAQRRLPRRRRAGRADRRDVPGAQDRPRRRRRGPARRARRRPRVVLARPRCYMNESGGPVSALAKFYKVPGRADRRDPRRARHPLRHAAGQARRRRQRPQRAAVDARARWAPATSTGCGSASAGRPGRQAPADFVLSDYSVGRAQGAAVPGRPGRRRRRVPAHRGPREDPERLQQLDPDADVTDAAADLSRPRPPAVADRRPRCSPPGPPPSPASCSPRSAARASRARSSRTPATWPPTTC